MTLLDLCRLLKKNWLIVVAVPVACALVCLGVAFALPPLYSAKATLLATGNYTVLSGTAVSVSYQKTAQTGLEVKAENTPNSTVTITVRGSNAQECIDVANAAAARTRELTLQHLAETSEADEIAQEVKAAAAEALAASDGVPADDTAFYALALLTADDTTISITEATAAANVSPVPTQYVIIAAIAGLLLALAIIILKDMARGSVHNAYEVEENYDLRLLGNVRSASAKRRSDAAAEDATLLAALDFAGADAQAVCLIPTEDAESAKHIVSALEGVAEAAGKQIACIGKNGELTLSNPDALAKAIAAQKATDADLAFALAPPVANSADFAYLAPACGCAVLVVEAMRTKRTHLETALRQLSLSNTPVVGFILVNAA